MNRQIVFNSVSIGYDKHPVIQELSFSVNKGDYLCIVGENGAGKSTLMKTMLGLIPKISGDIVFSDDISRKDVGYLSQQTQVQKDFPASVYEIVLSGFQNKCGLRPFYTKAEITKALENIEKMGITHLKHRCFRELSGGQQQRALLARALCAADKILILDEPVAGLDPDATREMYNLIKKLNSEGLTIIMISHDLEGILEQASHILHIGQRTFYGTTAEYLSFRQLNSGLSKGGLL